MVDDEDSFDEDFDLEDELSEEEDELLGEEEQAEAPQEAAPEAAAAAPAAAEASTEQPVVPLEEIPISLVAEVGRVRMSLDKLMALRPGNLIELGVDPASGVDLVVNNRCVGRGELVQVGDTLGVRIIEKG